MLCDNSYIRNYKYGFIKLAMENEPITSNIHLHLLNFTVMLLSIHTSHNIVDIDLEILIPRAYVIGLPSNKKNYFGIDNQP